jgi:tetratricopeptide (TPR) repeat protein
MALLNGRRDLNLALVEFRQAVRIDSTHARAYAGIADVYAMTHLEPGLAEGAARQALRLDPGLAGAWASLGFALAMQEWDWNGADAALSRALDLEPDNTKALQWMATLRMIQRRFDGAVSLLQRAITIEARVGLYADLCQVEYYRGNYTRAAAACQRARHLEPAYAFVDDHELRLNLVLDRPAPAAAILERQGFAGPLPDDRSALLRVLVDLADNPAAGPNRHVVRAEWLALSGDKDGALAALELAVEERAFLVPFLNADPTVDSIRDEPRFRAAMGRIGLR